MISHASIGVRDLNRAIQFYDTLLGIIGAKEVIRTERAKMYGTSVDEPKLMVCIPFDKKEASVGNGSMVMIQADSQESVKELYDKALELGASDEGSPDDRAGGKIYAAYIRDLDGNKIGFVHRPKS